MRTLKQVAKNMADAFTRFGLWKGGGSGGSVGCSNMVDFDNVITTISGAKRIEYTAQENCYLYKQTVATGSNGNEKISINGNIIGWTIYTNGTTIGGYALIPLKKDDTIIVENVSDLSFTWQPITIYGVVKENYLHEYNTEEKIIGKWIDGKPIYEKTFTGLSFKLDYVGWRAIINISNINTIISGFGVDNFNQLFYPIALGKINEEVDWYQSNSIGNTISTLTVQYTKTTN